MFPPFLFLEEIVYLLFIISFLLLALKLCYSSFLRFLRWKLRLLTWDFSSFLMCLRSAINFPFSMTLTVPHKFQYVIFSFSFSFIYFKMFIETSSLTYGLFKSVIFSFQMFGDFPVICLLLISRLIPLLLENTLYMVSIVLNFKLILPRMWSTLVYVLWALENNVY